MLIYCRYHNVNHRITSRDAEDLINGLAAELAIEQSDGNVYTNPVDDDDADTRTNQWCPVDHLPHLRSTEMFYEHLESMRECRLAH